MNLVRPVCFPYVIGIVGATCLTCCCFSAVIGPVAHRRQSQLTAWLSWRSWSNFSQLAGRLPEFVLSCSLEGASPPCQGSPAWLNAICDSSHFELLEKEGRCSFTEKGNAGLVSGDLAQNQIRVHHRGKLPGLCPAVSPAILAILRGSLGCVEVAC